MKHLIHSTPVVVFAVSAAIALAERPEPLEVVSWNLGSRGSDPAVIAEQLCKLRRYDVFCLQRVPVNQADRYVSALRSMHGESYGQVLGSPADQEQLLILFDEQRLSLLKSQELNLFKGQPLHNLNHTSPLVLRLQEKTAGPEFFLITLCLANNNEKLLKEQAISLRKWGERADHFAIAIGTFNFRYTYDTSDTPRPGVGERSGPTFENVMNDPEMEVGECFKTFMGSGDLWAWILPAVKYDTHWTDQDGDGEDDTINTMDDLSFITRPREGSWDGLHSRSKWKVSPMASVVFREVDSRETSATSDHRPISLKMEWINVEHIPEAQRR